MNTKRTTGLAACVLGMLATSADAAQYHVYFVGSEARAIQAGTMIQPAGYVGAPGVAPVAPLSAPPIAAGYVSPAACPAPGACAAPLAAAQTGPYHGAGTPNQIVTFLHPYTNQAITIPLTLPVGRPKIVTKSDRIIYDYGLFSQKVIVKFLPDGLVDVIYRG